MNRSPGLARGQNQFLKPKLSFWGLLGAAGAVVCVFTVSGFLGSWHWIFDETSHFRVHYALGLFALAVVFAVGRKIRLSAIFAGFAVVNLAVIVPYCFVGPGGQPSNGPRIRVLLINVRTENQRYDAVKDFIRQSRPDVVVVEEVDNSWMEQLAELRDVLPDSCSAPRADNFGIALFSRWPLTNKTIRYFGPAEVPSVTAELEIDGTRVLLVGTHPLPPGTPENTRSRNEQLDEVADFVAAQSGPLILAGDFNTTPWSNTFRHFTKKSRLIDSARGFGYQATWPAGLGFLGIPLDHCFATRGFRFVDRRTGPLIGSDHLPVLIEIEVLPPSPH